LRFDEKSSKDCDDHLDIHFRKARRLQENIRRTVSRQWFGDEKNWIASFSVDKDDHGSKRPVDRINYDNDDVNNNNYYYYYYHVSSIHTHLIAFKTGS